MSAPAAAMTRSPATPRWLRLLATVEVLFLLALCWPSFVVRGESFTLDASPAVEGSAALFLRRSASALAGRRLKEPTDLPPGTEVTFVTMQYPLPPISVSTNSTSIYITINPPSPFPFMLNFSVIEGSEGKKEKES